MFDKASFSISVFLFWLLLCTEANTRTRSNNKSKSGPKGKLIRETPVSATSKYSNRIGINAKAQIEELIVDYMESNKVPGISIAGGKYGRILYANAFGYSVKPNETINNNEGIEASVEDLFRVGSISKVITATVMMKMVEKQTLSLEDLAFDTGSGGILQVPIESALQPFLSKVRVRHLLEHSAGFRSGLIQEQPGLNNDDFLKWAISNYSLAIEPGTRYVFSNFGYFVLGRIIEKKTGKTYEEFVRQEFKIGMGIEDAHIGGATLAERRSNEAKYYDTNNPNKPYSYNFRRLDSSAGWIMSTVDLLKFFFVTMPDDQVDLEPQGYLKKETVERMLTPNTNLSTGSNQWRIALGWRIYVSAPSADVMHLGDFDGIETHINSYVVNFEDPREDVRYSYIILINGLGNLRNYTDGLFRAFTGLLVSAEEYAIPKGPIPIGNSNYSKILSEADQSKIAILARKFMEENKLPGMSIAFSRNGRLVYANGFGYADISGKIPVTSDHRFRTAGLSKPITSIAIMKLVEEGKLSLDDKIFGPGSHLGTISGFNLTDWHKQMTIRHLLQHTLGGWSRAPPDPLDDAPTLSHSTFIPYALRLYPLELEPGTDFSDSNMGYFLLGRIIEKVIRVTENRNLSYAEIIQSKFLHLPQVGACSIEQALTRIEDTKPLECKYYSSELKEIAYIREMSRRDASGAWIASAIDLLRVFVAFDEGERLLKENTKKEMLTGSNPNPDYGLGFGVNSSDPMTGDAWKKRRFFHEGDSYGYNSYMYRLWMPAVGSMTEGSAIFTMLMNGDNMNLQVEDSARQFIADVLSSISNWLSEELKIPQCKTPDPSPTQAVTTSSTPGEFPLYAIVLIVIGVVFIVLLVILIGLIIGFQIKNKKQGTQVAAIGGENIETKP